MNHENSQHSVRRIVLPSGRSIEVVRFNEGGPSAPRALHICPSCESELVQPIDWNEADEDRWELLLVCPNCEWSEEGVFAHEQIHELEERLDDGLADMLRDLQRLTQANMAEQMDRFIEALHRDHILPEDF
jgi:hypothetical protein